MPDQLRELAAMGMRTIKMFTTYRGETMADDETIFKVMKELQAQGGMAFVHCEANHIIEDQQERSAASGRIAARYHRRDPAGRRRVGLGVDCDRHGGGAGHAGLPGAPVHA